MEHAVRGAKCVGKIESAILLATVNKSLINFDINSIVVMASPRYFVSMQHMPKMNYALCRRALVPRVFNVLK